jgi:hypothetical protein
MSVAAEHPLRIAGPSVGQRSCSHFARKAKPHGVEPFQEAHDSFLSE